MLSGKVHAGQSSDAVSKYGTADSTLTKKRPRERGRLEELQCVRTREGRWEGGVFHEDQTVSVARCNPWQFVTSSSEA